MYQVGDLAVVVEQYNVDPVGLIIGPTSLYEGDLELDSLKSNDAFEEVFHLVVNGNLKVGSLDWTKGHLLVVNGDLTVHDLTIHGDCRNCIYLRGNMKVTGSSLSFDLE